MKNRSTGRLGHLFNAVIPETAARSARGSQAYEKTTRFPITTFGNDAGRGYLRGFTLIELLVVVLIIGILSAIALPQYQKAVGRTRVVKALPLLRSIIEARQRSFLANEEYATDLDALDIGIPYTSKEAGDSWVDYYGTPIGYFRLPEGAPCVFAQVKTYGEEDWVVFDFCPDRKECYSFTSQASEQICASLGKKSRIGGNGRQYYSLDL